MRQLQFTTARAFDEVRTFQSMVRTPLVAARRRYLFLGNGHCCVSLKLSGRSLTLHLAARPRAEDQRRGLTHFARTLHLAFQLSKGGERTAAIVRAGGGWGELDLYGGRARNARVGVK